MEFKLPEIGEGVYEAEVVRWLVQAGDAVKPGQTLVELLTDKATMEVPAPFAGVIQELSVEPGQKVAVGDVLLQYEGKKGAAPAPAKEDGKPKAAAKDESKPKAAAKEDADTETPEEAEAEEEETKPKPKAKEETKPKAPAKDNGKPKPTAPKHAPEPARDNGARRTAVAVKAAPSVRLMARKLGVDLEKIHGSGPDGRVLVDDLAQHVPGGKPVAPAPDYGKPGTRVKFAGVRRKIAEHMVQSKQTIPHFSYVDECDVTDLVRMRESLKEPFANKGAKLTYLAFFVKAVVAALKEVPIVNATLDEEAGEIVLRDAYHIGIAVAAPAGLIVPVIHDADQKSLFDIAQEIERLSNDARDGKSKLDDLRGGTFSITSTGNLGGLFATPIILPPQLGILGVGKIVKRPIYDDHGQLKSADMLYLSFSFDHRILDGAVGAAFGNAIIRQLQNPALLLL